MQGKDIVITKLNHALFLELSAVNQYWLHYRLLENWGYIKLAEKERKESLDEMNHVDRLIKRILFLEGTPDLQSVAPLRVGRSLKEVLQCDLDSEYDARKAYCEARDVCEKNQDYTTMRLFESLIEEEERHIDFLETQLSLIVSLGEESYAQLQARKD